MENTLKDTKDKWIVNKGNIHIMKTEIDGINMIFKWVLCQNNRIKET